jgi:hypothetical protein
MKTAQQTIPLQKVIIQLHHRLVYREAIERSTLIYQRIDAACLVAFEGIASAFGCGTRFEAFEV